MGITAQALNEATASAKAAPQANRMGLRVLKEHAAKDLQRASSNIHRWLKLAKSVKPALEHERDAVEVRIAEAEAIVVRVTAAGEALATVEEDLEVSAAEVTHAREVFVAASMVASQGSTSRDEALRARDDRDAAASALSFLEAGHERLKSSHSASASASGESDRFIQRTRDASRTVETLAASFSGPFGLSPSDVARAASTVPADRIGLILVAAPAVTETIEPRRRRVDDAYVTDRTRADFAAAVTLLVRCAVEESAKLR